jgi:hypothetical protein
MSMIDWSDPQEMLGLLVEYVADERFASHDDTDRTQFLNGLWEELAGIAEQKRESLQQITLRLQDVFESQPREFAGDPVMGHVEACIEELHRIGKSQSS